MNLQIYKDFIKSLEKVSDSSDEIFVFQSQIWKTCLKYKIAVENTSKMIALSSASYTFENLYKTYKDWTNKIYSPEKSDTKYFISQLGYELFDQNDEYSKDSHRY